MFSYDQNGRILTRSDRLIHSFDAERSPDPFGTTLYEKPQNFGRRKNHIHFLYPWIDWCTFWCTIWKSIRYDEIPVGYTNWWLKARFRSISSSRKMVRTMSGTRRSETATICDLKTTLKNTASFVKISKTTNIHCSLIFLIWGSVEGSTYNTRTPRAQRAHF